MLGQIDPIIAVGLIIAVLLAAAIIFRVDEILFTKKEDLLVVPKKKTDLGESQNNEIITGGLDVPIAKEFKVNEKYDLNELYGYGSGSLGNARIALRRKLNENYNLVTEFQYILMAALGFVVVGMFGLWLYPHPLTFLGGAIIGVFLPEWWLKREKRGYYQLLEKQAINLTQLVVQGLHAGLGLTEALQSSGNRLGAPINTETNFLAARVNMGTPLEDVIAELRKQTPSKFLEKMYTIILVAKRNGLDDEAVRNRLSLVRQGLLAEYHLRMAMKAAASGGIMTKNLMTFMVPGIIIFVFKRSPDVLAPLFSGMGILVLFLGVGLFLAAIAFSNKIIAKLEF